MDMPKPTEKHRWLERYAGKWQGKENMHPSAWCPTAMVAEGRMNNRVGLDGFVVIGDYEQLNGGQVCFSGHAVYTYDAKTDEYLLNWYDVMNPACEVFRGRPNGESISFVSVGQMGHHRLTHDFGTTGVMKSKMEMSKDGTSWTTLFDGTYSRQA
jgi:hypothetical protein